jgi:hypothetical protein
MRRPKPLPPHHLQPARDVEQLLVEAHDTPGRLEQLKLLLQRVRDVHVPAIAPEFRVLARGDMVVQDQEIADRVKLEIHLPIEFVHECPIAMPVGKERDQLRNTDLNEVYAGRLERLQEPARQAEGNTVLLPDLPTLARHEAQLARLCQGLAREVCQQRASGRLDLRETAGKDVPVAGPVLQRDAPLPPRVTRRRPREGIELARPAGRNGQGPVAGQPVRPVFIAAAKRLFDQHPLNPLQSTKRSPSMVAPVSRVSETTNPVSPSRAVGHDRPSTRRTPRASAYWRR